MQDVLLLPKSVFSDPWNDKTGKKRIIYAPHHSIKGTNGTGIEFSTFLEYGESILELAKKYKERVTMAFKPHPNLYMKLVDIWGQQKTDGYYEEWQSLDNTQVEDGEYMGLFKYSDAIIHDCASFIVEYMYMDKPAMYLVSESNRIEDMFDFVQKAYMNYEHGRSLRDIDNFIVNVIYGIDKKRDERHAYIQSNLRTPNGKSACENIIDAIIGR